MRNQKNHCLNKNNRNGRKGNRKERKGLGNNYDLWLMNGATKYIA